MWIYEHRAGVRIVLRHGTEDEELQRHIANLIAHMFKDDVRLSIGKEVGLTHIVHYKGD